MEQPEHAAWGLSLVLLAAGAAAQPALPRAVAFDGARSGKVLVPEAVSQEVPVPGAVREVKTGWDFEIIIGDPRGRGPWDHDPWGRDPWGQRPGHGGWRWERVKQLAHEAEETAEHLHRDAESREHHDDWREERFLRATHELEEAARHFHRQVEAWRQDPSHSRSDYYSLSQALRDVEWTIRDAHVDQHVWSDYQSLRRIVDELDSAYRGGYGHDDGHGDPHGGYPPRRRRGGHGH